MADVRGNDTKAEARYRKRVEYMPYRVALGFYIGVSVAITALFALQGHTIHQQCLDGQKNRAAIRETVIEGLSSLGARYDPEHDRVEPHGKPIDYYVTHWSERQRALNQAIHTLARFPRVECHGGFNVLGNLD